MINQNKCWHILLRKWDQTTKTKEWKLTILLIGLLFMFQHNLIYPSPKKLQIVAYFWKHLSREEYKQCNHENKKTNYKEKSQKTYLLLGKIGTSLLQPVKTFQCLHFFNHYILTPFHPFHLLKLFIYFLVVRHFTLFLYYRFNLLGFLKSILSHLDINRTWFFLFLLPTYQWDDIISLFLWRLPSDFAIGIFHTKNRKFLHNKNQYTMVSDK